MTQTNSNSAQRLGSESRVWRALSESGDKMTISQIVHWVNANASEGEPPLVEMTIRRCIQSLIKRDMVARYGKEGNAHLYGKIGVEAQSGGEAQVPFAEQLVSAEEFFRMIVSEDSHPLQKSSSRQIFSVDFEKQVRRMLAFAILTAGQSGMNDKLRDVMHNLGVIQGELEHVTRLISNFLNSAVWYEQYRDRLALENRKIQERDPELIQLVFDFVQGG